MLTLLEVALPLALERVTREAAAGWLPMFCAWWVVAPLLRRRRGWPLEAYFLLGLLWDAALEQVVGPGAVAWSASVLLAEWVVARVALSAWRLAGVLAFLVTFSVQLVLWASRLPLGLPLPLGFAELLWRPLGTAVVAAVAARAFGVRYRGEVGPA